MDFIFILIFLKIFAGYNGTGNEWDEYPRYTNSDGVEMASVSVYA